MDDLTPFQRDALLAGYTMPQVHDLARRKYDEMVTVGTEAGYEPEEVKTKAASRVYKEFGFNFGDSVTREQAKAEFLEASVEPSAIAKGEAISDYDDKVVNDTYTLQPEVSKDQNVRRKQALRGHMFLTPAPAGPAEPIKSGDSIAAQISRGLSAGTQMSSGYKGIIRGGAALAGVKTKPYKEDFNRPMGGIEIAALVGAQVIGDIPVFLAGALPGGVVGTPGGPVVQAAAAGAGGFAAVEAVNKAWEIADREISSTDSSSFFNELMEVPVAAGKGAIIGGATGGVGAKVAQFTRPAGNFIAHELVKAGTNRKAANVIGAMANHGVQIPAEAATMVATSSALEGHLPTKENFFSAAALIGAMRLSGFYNGKLRNYFKEHNFTPITTLKLMAENPLANEQVRSANQQRLLDVHGEHSTVWAVQRNGDAPLLDAEAARNLGTINKPGTFAMTMDEYVGEKMGYTRQRYNQWAKVTAENELAGIAGPRDAYGRPDPNGKVGRPLPTFARWRKGQIDVAAKHAMEPIEAQELVDINLASRGPGFEGTYKNLDADQVKRIRSLTKRYKQAALEYDGLMRGTMHIAGAETVPGATNQSIRNRGWLYVAQDTADVRTQRVNESNLGKDYDPKNEHAYSATQLAIPNTAKTLHIPREKDKHDLVKRFIDYMDIGKDAKTESYGKVYGKGITEQATSLFNEMPREFAAWLREGKGNPKIEPIQDPQKQAIQKQYADRRQELSDEYQAVSKKIDDIGAIPLSNRTAEQTQELGSLIAQRKDINSQTEKAKQDELLANRALANSRIKRVAPHTLMPDNQVDVLAYGDQLYLLNPAMERSITQAGSSTKTVSQAAADIAAQISKDKKKGIWSPKRSAQITYGVLFDKYNALNQPASVGEQSIPYLAARMYAGIDGAAMHWLEFGRTLFARKEVTSIAGLDIRESGGISLADTISGARKLNETLDITVKDALADIVGQVGKNTQKELVDTLALAVDIVKEVRPGSDINAREMTRWLEDVKANLFDSPEALAEQISWSRASEQDSIYLFRALATAKHAQELTRKGIPHGLNEASVNAIADNAILNKVYNGALKEIKEYQNALIDYQVKGELLTPEQGKKLKEEYEFNVPFERILEETGAPLDIMQAGRAVPQEVAGVTPGKIIDPIESIVRETFNTMRRVEKNQVLRLIADQFGLHDTGKKQIEVGTLFDWAEFRIGEKNIEGNKVIEYYREGQKVTTQVPEAIFNAASNLSPASANAYSNVLMRMAAGISSWLRVGVTLSPKFAAKNPIRDVMSAYIQSDSGFNPITSIAEGLGAVASSKTGGAVFPGLLPLYKEWLRSGGAHSDIVGADRKPIQDALNKLSQPKPWKAKLTRTEQTRLEAAMVEANAAFVKGQRTNFADYKKELKDLYPQYSEADFNALFEASKPNGPTHYLSQDMIHLLQQSHKPHNSVSLTQYGINSIMRMLNPKNWLGGLQELSSATESGTRIGEYIAARRSGTTMVESAYRARESSIDFSRMGATIQSLNAISTFLNANIQGPDRFVRQMIARPLETMSRVTAGIVIPAIFFSLVRNEYMASNPDDPLSISMREMPDYERQVWWTIPVPALGVAFKLPKPFEYASVFTNPIESYIDWAYQKDPSLTWMQNMSDDGTFLNARDQFWLTSNKWLSASIPQGAKGVVELEANYSMFTGQSIIPAAQLDSLPSAMYTRNTSELAKELSYRLDQVDKLLGGSGIQSRALSPIGIEHLIRSYTGTLGIDAFQMLSAGLGKVDLLPDKTKSMRGLEDVPLVSAFIVKNPGSSARSIGKFYDDITALEASAKTSKRLYKEGTTFSLKVAEGMAYTNSGSASKFREAMNNCTKIIKAIDANKEWSQDEKREQIDRVIAHQIQIAIAGRKYIKELKQSAKEYWEVRQQNENSRD